MKRFKHIGTVVCTLIIGAFIYTGLMNTMDKNSGLIVSEGLLGSAVILMYTGIIVGILLSAIFCIRKISNNNEEKD